MKKNKLTLLGIALCVAMLFYQPKEEMSAAVHEIETASNAEKEEIQPLSAMETGMAEAICRQKHPQIMETAEISEEEAEEEERSAFFLTNLSDEKGVSFAEKLLKELLQDDAAFFSNIYDRMADVERKDAKASVTLSFVNGDHTAVTASSNVQRIVSMTSVYAEECGITDWQTIRKYAVTLWERSHALTETAKTVFCEGGMCSVSLQTASNSNYAEPETATAECPGHLSVALNGMICQDEAGGLYSVEPVTEEVWDGWTEELKEKVSVLSERNWKDEFGIVFQVYETKMPLSNTEISSYLAMLPEDTSEVRQNLIRFALQSVGRVPYYWGGKPSASGYAGNHFGSFVEPDKENRTVRGLDCSGWISWVYWSVTGNRLPYESTAGISTLGRAVSLEEMKPGDIALDTGEDSHIILYLGQDENGTRYCIHESAQRGTVSVTAIRSNWQFYRNLLD